jgi:hypothetical protein
VGDGQVTSPQKTFTEIFEEAFPSYLAMGMSWTQFWIDEPELAVAYRKSEMIRKRRKNEELWLEGVYVAEALRATVGNMFNKGQKNQYPAEPFPITADEQQERREREERNRMERMKAAFIARSLQMNAKLGGEPNDECRKESGAGDHAGT